MKWNLGRLNRRCLKMAPNMPTAVTAPTYSASFVKVQMHLICFKVYKAWVYLNIRNHLKHLLI